MILNENVFQVGLNRLYILSVIPGNVFILESWRVSNKFGTFVTKLMNSDWNKTCQIQLFRLPYNIVKLLNSYYLPNCKRY